MDQRRCASKRLSEGEPHQRGSKSRRRLDANVNLKCCLAQEDNDIIYIKTVDLAQEDNDIIYIKTVDRDVIFDKIVIKTPSKSCKKVESELATDPFNIDNIKHQSKNYVQEESVSYESIKLPGPPPLMYNEENTLLQIKQTSQDVPQQEVKSTKEATLLDSNIDMSSACVETKTEIKPSTTKYPENNTALPVNSAAIMRTSTAFFPKQTELEPQKPTLYPPYPVFGNPGSPPPLMKIKNKKPVVTKKEQTAATVKPCIEKNIKNDNKSNVEKKHFEVNLESSIPIAQTGDQIRSSVIKKTSHMNCSTSSPVAKSSSTEVQKNTLLRTKQTSQDVPQQEVKSTKKATLLDSNIDMSSACVETKTEIKPSTTKYPENNTALPVNSAAIMRTSTAFFPKQTELEPQKPTLYPPYPVFGNPGPPPPLMKIKNKEPVVTKKEQTAATVKPCNSIGTQTCPMEKPNANSIGIQTCTIVEKPNANSIGTQVCFNDNSNFTSIGVQACPVDLADKGSQTEKYYKPNIHLYNLVRNPEISNSTAELRVMTSSVPTLTVAAPRNVNVRRPLVPNVPAVLNNKTIPEKTPIPPAKEVEVSRAAGEPSEKVPKDVINFAKNNTELETPGIRWCKKTEGEKKPKNLLSPQYFIRDTKIKNSKLYYHCKLCEGKFIRIVDHYLSYHPDSEVLISRLSPEEAKLAVAEGTELPTYHRYSKKYCRFCVFDTNSMLAFADHISSHTGEYRYLCNWESDDQFCNYKSSTEHNVRVHYNNIHAKKCYKNDEDEPINFKIKEKYPSPNKHSGVLKGYLCTECNFVQMSEDNLKSHIKQHADSSDEEKTIVEINMIKFKRFQQESKPNKINIKIRDDMAGGGSPDLEMQPSSSTSTQSTASSPSSSTGSATSEPSESILSTVKKSSLSQRELDKLSSTPGSGTPNMNSPTATPQAKDKVIENLQHYYKSLESNGNKINILRQIKLPDASSSLHNPCEDAARPLQGICKEFGELQNTQQYVELNPDISINPGMETEEECTPIIKDFFTLVETQAKL